jgi:CheY-like chemotaxis protein
MSSPLVLLFYEKIIPGSQIVHRLQDMGYRVSNINKCEELVGAVRKHLPMVLIADLETKSGDVSGVIRILKEDLVTQHIPVLTYVSLEDKDLHEKARLAGANLIAGRDGVLEQLPHLMEHVLEID